MDQFGGQALKSAMQLLKASLKVRVSKAFPGIPENVLDLIQLNTVTNNLNYEYQSPSAVKIYNTLKSKNFFEGIKSEEDVARKIVETEVQDDYIKKIEVGDKGFINIALNDNFISEQVNVILNNGVRFPLDKKKKVIVDFSSPNIAKEMHVGHLRSTIIGESICRILEFQGHEVVRVNHVGDWGTQFGMLINYMFTKYPDYKTNKPELKELEEFYKEAKKVFDEDPEFKKQSQQYVVKLQSLDPVCIDAWKMICDLSRQEFQRVYNRLGVKITEYGESYYNPMLGDIVKECTEKGIVELDKGAQIIRIKGDKLPLMIVKSDGGFNYDTTDMAAAKVRLIEWKGDRLLYLTDVGQFNHFKLIFAASQMMGWHQPPKTSMEHMGFGLVKGPDGKKFSTREGKAVKLCDLLDEANARALKQIQSRAQEKAEGHEHSTGTALTPEEYANAAEKIGVAAIKYFDLKQNRISDYCFDYNKMLDPKGNTAVYLIYSYVRIVSILRKCGLDINEHKKVHNFVITHPHERHLAAQLIRFVDVVQSVTDQLSINWLCDYIYDICVKISEAYQQYRILDEKNVNTRILLCEAVKMVLLQSFHLVGIEPIEKI